MTEAIGTDVKTFIVDNFMFGEGGEKITSDQSFLQSGIIDSTGVLELVSFLEEKFKMKIKDDELIPQNLDSIQNIVSFVQKKTLA